MKERYPFVYDKGVMKEEPIVFFEKNGTVSAKLAFIPTAILKIYNPIKDIFLKEGEDFEIIGQEIVCSDCTKIKNVFFKEEWLCGKNLLSHIENLGPRYNIQDVLLIGAVELSAYQFRVTYTCDNPKFPQTVQFLKNVKRFQEKIRTGQEVKIVLFGDSICNAANSSGEANVAPFEKAWYEKALNYCREVYKNATINLHNRSRSGYGSDWGAEVAEEKIENADLLIVGFGMNDASDLHLSADEFEDNVRKILSERKNEDCDFLLISSILPNPQSELFRYELRKSYAERLKKICIEEKGAFINMLPVSEFYIGKKRYCEISGNNFNHPNDFIYKFYANALALACIQEE